MLRTALRVARKVDAFTFSRLAKPDKQDDLVYPGLPTKTCIRLVKCDGVGEDGLLNISLTVVDLDAQRRRSPYASPNHAVSSSLDPPLYHCLSYTWDNPHADGNSFRESFHARDHEYSDANTIKIRCDGKIHKIKKNLHDFLLQAPRAWTSSIRNRPHPETGNILLHDRVNGSPETLHTFVGFGDDVNWQNNDGQTPLHVAARLGTVHSVLVLLKGGASVHIKDHNGKTAEDVAREHEHYRVKDILKEAKDNGSDHVARDVPPFTVQSADDHIWIDALCIDQNNLDERASQVQIMGRIYSEASYVIVWLGEEDDHTEHALSAVRKLSDYAEEFAGSDLVPYRTHSQEEYDRYSIPRISDLEWRGLAALFLRQWFRRIWIVQEVAFANSIIVCCGGSRIQWPDLQRVVAALFRRASALGHDPSTIYTPIEENACGVSYHFETISSLRHLARESLKNSEVPGRSFEYHSLSGLGTPFKATDPMDKVYALLPLCTIRYGKELPMTPSYKISPSECYARFTLMQIMETGHLRAMVRTPDISFKKIQGLPSWVPDYSVSAAVPLRLDPQIQPALANLGQGKFHVEVSDDYRSLSLRGFPFDTVKNVAASRTNGKGPKKFELDNSWFDLLDTIGTSTSKQDSQPLGEVLWRTLCADASHNSRDTGTSPAPSEYGVMFRRVLCAMVCNQPEISARDADSTREDTIQLAGLLKTAAMMMHNGQSGPVRSRPDEEIMAAMRAELPIVERDINGTHFDSVRGLIPRLEALRSSGSDECIPDTAEIAAYFASASKPLRLPDGIVHLPVGCEPFLNAHSHAYGGRRLFTTTSGHLGLGPASIQPGDEIWLVPGFDETVITRRKRQSLAPLTRNRPPQHEFVGEAYVHTSGSSQAEVEVKEEALRDITLV